MRRKAQISGFSDLQWAGLIIIVLLIALIFVWATSGSLAEQAIQPITWEAGWLANSLAQQPVQDMTVLTALRTPAYDSELEELLNQFVEPIRTGKQQYMIAFLVRSDEIVSCQIKSTNRERISSCYQLESGAGAPWDNEPNYLNARAMTTANRALFEHTQDPQALQEKIPQSVGVGIVHGLNNTYVGVVVG